MRLSDIIGAFTPGPAQKGGEAPPPSFLPLQTEAARYSMPDLSRATAQAATYSQSGAVFFCVTRIAEAGAQVPLSVLRRVGEGTEQVKNHEFELLLQRPNPGMTRFSLMEQVFGFLELTGNAYWYLNKIGDTIVEIWPMRPDRVTPVPHPRDYISGYVYETEGKKLPLAPEEVVHFKRFNPLNDYVGLSAIQAAQLTIQRDTAGQRWSVGFFSRDNAVPASAVFFKSPIPDGEWERIRKEWYANYGGSGNSHKTALIRGAAGEVDIRTFGLPQREMQFLEQHQADWKDISLIFGVPLGKWSENATEANAIVADQTFWGDTMHPKLDRIAQQVTIDVLGPSYGEDLLAEFEDRRPKDRALQTTELQVVAAGNSDGRPIMTTDEIRARYFDLPPLAEVDPEAAEKPEPVVPLLVPPKQNPEPDGEDDEQEPPEPSAKATDEERQWRRWALARLKAGKELDGFVALHVPTGRRAEVRGALKAATTAEEVRAAFEPSPFRTNWEGYP